MKLHDDLGHGAYAAVGNAVIPCQVANLYLLAVFRGWELVASWSKVLGDGTIRGEEALRMSRGFEPLHAPLPLARRLVRVLGSIIQIPVLPVFDARQNLPFRCTIAF